jgi:hypothetical protein
MRREVTMGTLIPDLRQQIDEFQKATFPQLPKAILEPLMAGIDDLVLAGIDRGAIREGAKAPDFELPDAAGEAVRLSDLRARGPVVLSFYRGVW